MSRLVVDLNDIRAGPPRPENLLISSLKIVGSYFAPPHPSPNDLATLRCHPLMLISSVQRNLKCGPSMDNRIKIAHVNPGYKTVWLNPVANLPMRAGGTSLLEQQGLWPPN